MATLNILDYLAVSQEGVHQAVLHTSIAKPDTFLL